jgi:hypothetical protein
MGFDHQRLLQVCHTGQKQCVFHFLAHATPFFFVRSDSPIPVVQASTALAGDFRSFAWYDVRCSYEKTAANGKKKEVEVLHGISGHLESGHMLAVLGE